MGFSRCAILAVALSALVVTALAQSPTSSPKRSPLPNAPTPSSVAPSPTKTSPVMAPSPSSTLSPPSPPTAATPSFSPTAPPSTISSTPTEAPAPSHNAAVFNALPASALLLTASIAAVLVV